jgi:hypothetical protein
MEGMNIEGRRQRSPKQKVYPVDTRKPRAAAELSVLTPANGFEEIVSSKPLRKAPVHRYFRYLPDPIVGVPGGQAQLEAAFKAAAVAMAAAAAAAAAVLPPPAAGAGAPPLPPAPVGSQGSYGAMHEDEGVDDLANVLAEQGVGSQGEFDELAALMEQKAQIGGGGRHRGLTRRRNKRNNKSRRRRRHSCRSRR